MVGPIPCPTNNSRKSKSIRFVTLGSLRGCLGDTL